MWTHFIALLSHFSPPGVFFCLARIRILVSFQPKAIPVNHTSLREEPLLWAHQDMCALGVKVHHLHRFIQPAQSRQNLPFSNRSTNRL